MSNRFVAFLRGINVGGNKKVPMAQLKACFEAMGFADVKTLLNSGNVLFSSSSGKDLQHQIESKLEKEFKMKIPVIARSLADIQKLITLDPFKGIKVTPQTRLYVTFIQKPYRGSLKIPYHSKDGDFSILKVSPTEVCSVIIISTNKNTTDLMKVMDKEFGKDVTTRNWNTVLRLGSR